MNVCDPVHFSRNKLYSTSEISHSQHVVQNFSFFLQPYPLRNPIYYLYSVNVQVLRSTKKGQTLKK